MIETIFTSIEMVTLIGGKILDCIKKGDEVQVVKIPECEQNDKYDFYFINKRATCFTINNLGKSIEFKIVNNSNEKICAYIIDVKTRVIYSVVNEENKLIIINAKDNAKIKVENIDDCEQSVLYVSRDQGISWEYLQLKEFL